METADLHAVLDVMLGARPLLQSPDISLASSGADVEHFETGF